MEILYKSTRGDGSLITASQAVLKGLADDGGLFVPNQMPKLDIDLESLKDMNYKEIAFMVLKKFLTDYTDEELKFCVEHAYDSKFDTEEIAPVVEKDGKYFLELFHGATIAFKDMALSILPYLMTTAAKKNNLTKEIVILTATSGDTGKAALSGFADVPGTKIIVFYPKGGVSKIQELQMVTQKGENTYVVGVNGNFDNCQTGVKEMFNDAALNELLGNNNYQFSSANSINIGRLIPQVAYYVWAYSRLLKFGKINAGDEINFVVPTGNFGNILAGYYAKLMGLPVKTFVCASNENKVLFDFFETGIYNKNRDFILTTSPSMDILISSNLERLIYMIAGESEEENKKMMSDLQTKGSYEISDEMKGRLLSFKGGFATEEENAKTIKDLYEKTGYIIDPHTGIAATVCNAYMAKENDETKTVVVSTASPYKFIRAVMTAIDESNASKDDFELIDSFEEISGVKKPKAILDIMNAEIRHNNVCEISDMEKEVKGFLNI